MEAFTKTRVVIIGAGIAGIGAARMLCRHPGIDVTVLEATERIGGRIHSQNYGDDMFEMGAGFIHGQGVNPLYQLAKKHNLTCEMEMEEREVPADFLMQDGTRIQPTIVKETWNVLEHILDDAKKFAHVDDPKPDLQSNVGLYVRSLFIKYLGELSDSREIRTQREAIFDWFLSKEKTENGCSSMTDVSLYGFGKYTEFEGCQEVKLKRGYQPLLNVLLENIPDGVIKLGTKVERIFWLQLHAEHSNYPVTIQTSSQDVIGADYVIVTCSLGFLKEHSMSIFYPPLPEEKMEAISNLGYGTVNKIYLQFERPFWGEDVTGIQLIWDQSQPIYLNCLEHGDRYEDSEWFKGIHGFDVVQGQTNLLCGWIAGAEAEAMEQVPDDTIAKICHELLERFTDKCVPMPTKIKKTSWCSDPFARGSYSYIRAGHTPTDMDCLAAPLPYTKSPRLLFAGEATHRDYFSTTHGAMMSGEREAGRILILVKLAKETRLLPIQYVANGVN